jgi:hypothetical protein
LKKISTTFTKKRDVFWKKCETAQKTKLFGRFLPWHTDTTPAHCGNLVQDCNAKIRLSQSIEAAPNTIIKEMELLAYQAKNSQNYQK